MPGLNAHMGAAARDTCLEAIEVGQRQLQATMDADRSPPAGG
jgi:hypothetical protein